ncbi:concanavalin A-like lectin/glucanase domain-containing protein [Cladorrhinum sp. PSN259]|nr:concanavalin A-like lectin/glucanase domain-containing protein [Cladorrhinum sp. PSN259]
MLLNIPQPLAALLLLTSLTPNQILTVSAAAVKTVIPKTSFNSQAEFDTYWNYLYPWGTDHNGSARMSNSKTTLSNSTLTHTASRAQNQKPATHGGKSIPIRYLSGAVHAKQHFTVSAKGGFDFSAEFIAPTQRGTWPAFWLTGVDSWPPEIDIAEWKGNGKISFNTFNTSSQVKARDIDYRSTNGGDGVWRKVLCEVRDSGNGKGDVGIKFWLDGKMVETQAGRGFIGKAMYLIINLQMEGSSGANGPEKDTLFQTRNVEVVSYNP